jgi:hypothetical protein
MLGNPRACGSSCAMPFFGKGFHVANNRKGHRIKSLYFIFYNFTLEQTVAFFCGEK